MRQLSRAIPLVFCLLTTAVSAQNVDPTRLAKEVEELKARQAAVERKLEELLQALRRVDPSQGPQRPAGAPAQVANAINIEGAPFKGAATAPLTLVEFSDYECPFCRRHVAQTLPLIDQNYIRTGKVKYVFKNFPVDQHKLAFNAHQAALCAGDQGRYLGDA